jgi:lipid II:glycine glycyltransferase (peptidoglycan interpeptide bridge formation enzyme)
MLTNWNELIYNLPSPHVLQTREWAAVKKAFGWKPLPVLWVEEGGDLRLIRDPEEAEPDGTVQAAALILRRGVGLGINILYVPKGPLLADWTDPELRKRVVRDLVRIAREQGAVFVKMDPDVVLGTGVPGKKDAAESELGAQVEAEWKEAGWRFSDDQIQYRNTVHVDLTAAEEDILMRMKSKTRYNIRYAGRNGVVVRRGDRDDLEMLYEMYAETSVRGGFTIRGEEYYRTVWDEFLPSPGGSPEPGDPVAVPLIAEVEGEPVAGAVAFGLDDRVWYLHGMSTLEHREKMPTYAVQWEIMRWGKEQGCRVYDMWGAPDVFEREDPMWGVYRFKRGFGGEVVRTIGAWDYPVKPILYQLYNTLLPKVLNIMRWFGNRQTEEAAS